MYQLVLLAVGIALATLITLVECKHTVAGDVRWLSFTSHADTHKGALCDSQTPKCGRIVCTNDTEGQQLFSAAD